MLYFAYGSNMASAVMLDRCPDASSMGAARLAEHRLAFRLPSQRWGGHAADLIQGVGRDVWGVLWAITDDHLSTLDVFEARYNRYNVKPFNGRSVEAVTYQVKPELVVANGSPDPEYLAHLVAGAIEHELPAPYINHLRSFLAEG